MLPRVICERPILKLTVLFAAPYRPLPPRTPARRASTRTLVPAGQNFFGRKCTFLASNQCHAPRTGLEVRTNRLRSMETRSVTSRSKVIITGMPTPTVSPVESLPGMKFSIAKVSRFFTVEKEEVVWW
ncbi:hypothetical protein GCM10018952_33830 [Streptosporangium vulgare]